MRAESTEQPALRDAAHRAGNRRPQRHRQAVDGQPGHGFRFDDYTAEGLVAAVKEALDVYKTRERWREMQRAAMAGDFSWDVSAREYVKVQCEFRGLTNGI